MEPRFFRHIQLRDAETSELIWEGPTGEAALIAEQLPQDSFILDGPPVTPLYDLKGLKTARDAWAARLDARSKDNNLPQEARADAAALRKKLKDQEDRASAEVAKAKSRAQEARSKVRK